jgi:ABC-2 type transport system ATP-binding protein
VRIDGYDIFDEPDKAKKLIGYLPEHPPLYMNETPLEYLTFVGEAKGLRGEELNRQIDTVIGLTKIEHMKHRRISRPLQGVQPARWASRPALLGNPKVIILDEPTVGLDPFKS